MFMKRREVWRGKSSGDREKNEGREEEERGRIGQGGRSEANAPETGGKHRRPVGRTEKRWPLLKT